MAWATYSSFLVVAMVLVLVPGLDFAVVTRTLTGRDVDHDQAGLGQTGGEPKPDTCLGGLAAAGNDHDFAP